MYQAIYKCRLCGEVVKDEFRNWKSQKHAELCIALTEKKEPMHSCNDGSIGVLEYQGFKKVGRLNDNRTLYHNRGCVNNCCIG